MKIFVGSHIVFYLEGENSIDIVRILHQAMDVGSRLKP
jgi:plasmid stabilization system protein ParE